jgi:hypothetical protein
MESIFKKDPKQLDIVFFGAGNIGIHFYHIMYNFLIDCNSFCFMDNDSSLFGKSIFNQLIKDPMTLMEYNSDNLIIFITTNGYKDGIAEKIAIQLTTQFHLRHNIHFFLYEYVCFTALQLFIDKPAMDPWKLTDLVSLLEATNTWQRVLKKPEYSEKDNIHIKEMSLL